jgi:hypothetical protein
MTELALTCLICGKRLPRQEAKTDGEGRSVHEDCYAAWIAEQNQPSSVE